MNNKKIKGVKTLAGIDSLYYFLNCDNELYHKIYFEQFETKIISYSEDCFKIKFLGNSGIKSGFVGSFYQVLYKDIPLFRFGMKNPEQQKNILNIYVQLDGCGIYTYSLSDTLDFTNFFLSKLFDIKIDLNDCVVSRADINIFVNGINFKKDLMLDCFKTVTLAVGTTYGVLGNLQGLSFGKKTSDQSFKIYDKFQEMADKRTELQSHIKRHFFKENGFNLDKPLWNLEWSYKRAFLTKYNIFTVKDLFDSFFELFKLGFYNFVFLGFNHNQYRKLRESKHLHRLKPHTLWTYLQENSYIIEKEIYSNKILEKRIKQPSEAREEWYYMMMNAYKKKLLEQGYEFDNSRL